jgi:hypothetical protein
MRLLTPTIAVLSVLVGVSLASAPARAQVTLPPSAVVVDDNDPNFAKFGPPQWWYTATGTPFNVSSDLRRSIYGYRSARHISLSCQGRYAQHDM